MNEIFQHSVCGKGTEWGRPLILGVDNDVFFIIFKQKYRDGEMSAYRVSFICEKMKTYLRFYRDMLKHISSVYIGG